VGTARSPVVVDIDGRYFVGPDNGLMSVLTARAKRVVAWKITWEPMELSASFHGRDLFAPVAAALARGESPAVKAQPVEALEVDFGPADVAQIIYIDHYGNAMTGLRAADVSTQKRFVVRGHELAYRRVFGEAAREEIFWYANSLGLVEIAANPASAAGLLGLAIGDAVAAVT
jgi:S-adenosylmethionine hydrolase